MDINLILTIGAILNISLTIWLLLKLKHLPNIMEPSFSNNLQQIESKLQSEMAQVKEQYNNHIQQLFDTNIKSQNLQSTAIQNLMHSLQAQQESSTHTLQRAMADNYAQQHKQLHEVLSHSTQQLQSQFQTLTSATERHMIDINKSMETHLTRGFEKTNETFTNIIKRLAIIDDAQKKITDLSENVVSLQQILHDKRTRGVFGEIQLKALIENVLPENCYQLQYSLSNGLRADCALFLPQPSGTIIIDSKFPLENYRKLTDITQEVHNKIEVQRAFKQDIKKHIQDISEKYIHPPETSDGALMFIPAEAIFAEIHAHHPELVELAFQKKVWMASPSTLMAILTTAQTVLKDDATRKQIHIIQKHLKLLAKDFGRFEDRMEKLTKHLQQANTDAEQVHMSAKKISNHFIRIENVELTEDETSLMLESEQRE
mgnify:CR=1 FL=1|tara:strand:+ start:38990 stop:40279 length:1290 start_codon:yes stop_codon:yes gene_type:complete